MTDHVFVHLIKYYYFAKCLILKIINDEPALLYYHSLIIMN